MTRQGIFRTFAVSASVSAVSVPRGQSAAAVCASPSGASGNTASKENFLPVVFFQKGETAFIAEAISAFFAETFDAAIIAVSGSPFSRQTVVVSFSNSFLGRSIFAGSASWETDPSRLYFKGGLR